jgi:hypothetical protein
MRRRRVMAIAGLVASLALACGERVSVGFVDVPEAGKFVEDGGPPPFAFDAASAENRVPSAACTNLQCGDFCEPCDPDAATCLSAVFHVCDIHRECVPAQPGCPSISDSDSGLYVPCAGRTCGAPCTECDPTSADCPSPARGVCHVRGACADTPPDCR